MRYLLIPNNQPRIPVAVAEIAVIAPVNGFIHSLRKFLKCSLKVKGCNTVIVRFELLLICCSVCDLGPLTPVSVFSTDVKNDMFAERGKVKDFGLAVSMACKCRSDVPKP